MSKRVKITRYDAGDAGAADLLEELMEPLLLAAPADVRPLGRAIIRQEAAGVLAWAVASGYARWTCQHPGRIPTPAQARRWQATAERVRADARAGARAGWL